MKKKLSDFTIEDLKREAKTRKFLFGIFLGIILFTLGISIYEFFHNETTVTSYISLFLILFLPVMWRQYSNAARETKRREAF